MAALNIKLIGKDYERKRYLYFFEHKSHVSSNVYETESNKIAFVKLYCYINLFAMLCSGDYN